LKCGKNPCEKVLAKADFSNYDTVTPPSDGSDEPRQPALIMAALRVGCAPQLDASQSISDAIKVACSCDHVVAVIGTNMDIEGEGGDRPDLKLPGKTDDFIRRLLEARPDAVIVNQSVSVRMTSLISGISSRHALDRCR